MANPIEATPELTAEEFACVLADVENVCSPEEARRRVRYARSELKRMLMTSEEVVGAVVFLLASSPTRQLSTIDLHRGLFYLDLEHLLDKGYTLTNLTYSAHPSGPCVQDSLDELTKSGLVEYEGSTQTFSLNTLTQNRLYQDNLGWQLALDEGGEIDLNIALQQLNDEEW